MLVPATDAVSSAAATHQLMDTGLAAAAAAVDAVAAAVDAEQCSSDAVLNEHCC